MAPPWYTGGWLGRVSVPVAGGALGLNALEQRHQSWGLSADLALPVTPMQLDAYAEVGVDPRGRHLETYGLYFPRLYQSAGVDLWVELARRQHFPAVWSALAYVEGKGDWTGLVGARKAQGEDTEFMVGAVGRFGRLAC